MQSCSWLVDGREARAWRRPDDRWVVRLPEDVASWPAVVNGRPEPVTELVLDRPEELPREQEEGLRAAGFRPARTEQLWRVPLRSLARQPVTAPTHTLEPVTSCDLGQVVDLDDAVRRQIPGCEGWRGTLEDLRESLADDELDPDLYRVAVDRVTGSYDGLVRVWNRPDLPRVGCLGVRPEWRRTRLAPALLGAVVTVLLARGVREVVTETDVANQASYRLVERHGGVPVGQTVEWVLDGGGRGVSRCGAEPSVPRCAHGHP